MDDNLPKLDYIGGKCEELDIFVKRILSKFQKNNLQIFFKEDLGTKKPVEVLIPNLDNDEDKPVMCVPFAWFKIVCIPENLIICHTKSKIIIKFKIVIIADYGGCNTEKYELPKDYDPFESGPQVIEEPYKEKLETVYSSSPKKPKYFKYTIDVPLKEFDGYISECQFSDPSLQSHVLLRITDKDIEVDGVVSKTEVREELEDKCPPSKKYYTKVFLSIFGDVLDKIGVEQDVKVMGNAEDFVCGDD